MQHGMQLYSTDLYYKVGMKYFEIKALAFAGPDIFSLAFSSLGWILVAKKLWKRPWKTSKPEICIKLELGSLY